MSKKSSKVWILVITFMVIAALLSANIVYGGMNNTLAPDTQKAIEKLGRSPGMGLPDSAWELFNEMEKAREGDRNALEGLIAFIGKKYVDGKEGDEEFNQVAAYLIMEHNAGAYLAEIDRVMKALREVAERVEKEYPMDKCWHSESIGDPERGVFWTKKELQIPVGLHLMDSESYFDCFSSIYIEEWLIGKGINAKALEITPSVISEHVGPGLKTILPEHVINLIEIEDPIYRDKLPSLRIAMGITPLDMSYGIVPFAVINHSPFDYKMVMKGKPFPEEHKRLIRSAAPLKNLDSLQSYYKTDSPGGIYANILVKPDREGISIYATISYTEVHDLAFRPYPSGIGIRFSRGRFLEIANELNWGEISGNAQKILSRWKDRGWIEYLAPIKSEITQPHIQAALEKGMQMVLEDVLMIIYKIARAGVLLPKESGSVRIRNEIINRMLNQFALSETSKAILIRIFQLPMIDSASQEILATVILRAGNCGIQRVVFRKGGKTVDDVDNDREYLSLLNQKLKEVKDIGINGTGITEGLKIKIAGTDLVIDMDMPHPHLGRENEVSLRQYLQSITPGAYQTVDIETLSEEYNLDGCVVEGILRELGFQPVGKTAGNWKRIGSGKEARVLDESV